MGLPGRPGTASVSDHRRRKPGLAARRRALRLPTRRRYAFDPPQGRPTDRRGALGATADGSLICRGLSRVFSGGDPGAPVDGAAAPRIRRFPVDEEILGRDPARTGAGEEAHDVGDLVDLAEPSKRGHRGRFDPRRCQPQRSDAAPHRWDLAEETRGRPADRPSTRSAGPPPRSSSRVHGLAHPSCGRFAARLPPPPGAMAGRWRLRALRRAPAPYLPRVGPSWRSAPIFRPWVASS